MDNPYSPPNTPTENLSNTATYSLYKITGITIATFFGSILAGGILLAANFRRQGDSAAANQAVIYSLIATVAVLALSFFIPESWHIPNMILVIPQIMAMRAIATNLQGSKINEHVNNGGAMESNWKAFGLSLLVLCAVMAVVFLIVYLTMSDASTMQNSTGLNP